MVILRGFHTGVFIRCNQVRIELSETYLMFIKQHV